MVLAFAGIAGAELAPIAVKSSPADERTPAADGSWFSWTQSSHAHPNRTAVFAQRGSDPKIKVNRPGTLGENGGIDGHILVYHERKGNYAGDIRKFNLETQRRSNFPSKVSTRWDEYHPTMSGPWVLFSRYFSSTKVTKVLLYNTHTHALRTLDSGRALHTQAYSGQVNGDYAAWGHVRSGGADVYLYRISTKTTTKIPRLVHDQYAPSVAADGTIYYFRSGNECGATVKLVRYPAGGPATVLYSFPAGVDGGFQYVQEQTDGSLHTFYGRVTCRNTRWDIHKVIDSHTIQVSKDGTGTGTVTSVPAGIDCGTSCQAVFHGGTVVTLTATPDSGLSFTGWSDASCGANPTCQVTVEDDVPLTATFGP